MPTDWNSGPFDDTFVGSMAASVFEQNEYGTPNRSWNRTIMGKVNHRYILDAPPKRGKCYRTSLKDVLPLRRRRWGRIP